MKVIDKNEYISKIEVVRILQKAYAEGRIKAKDGLVSVLDDINAAAVQPIDRWINVNDRLPKEQETVIVYEKDYGVMWGDYQGIKYSQPVWIVRKSGLIIRTTEVTHWRHLPEPPK